MEVHYVYLLYVYGVTVPAIGQPGSRDTYVGIARFPYARLQEHNSGKVIATRGRKWQIKAMVPCQNRKEAAVTEQWLKCGDTRGKRWRMACTFSTVRKLDAPETRSFISDALLWASVRAAKRQHSASLRGDTNVR